MLLTERLRWQQFVAVLPGWLLFGRVRLVRVELVRVELGRVTLGQVELGRAELDKVVFGRWTVPCFVRRSAL